MSRAVPPTKSALAITRGGASIRRQTPHVEAVIDTREKLPFFVGGAFKNWIKKVHVKTLETGDYSALGYESRITLERKTLSDLVGTLTGEENRPRFLRELERMKSFERACILIEASREDVKSPYRFAEGVKAHPNSVVGSLDAIAAKYPHIQIAYMSNRNLAEEFAASWLSKSATYLWLEDHGLGLVLQEGDL